MSIKIMYGLCVLFAFLAVIAKQKKLCYMIAFSLLVLVMSAQNFAEDELNIYNAYITNANSDLPLYNLIASTCLRFGLSFGWFNFVTVFGTLLIIFKVVKVYIGKVEIFALMYILGSALLDVVFFRQFLATGLVLCAFIILSYDKNPVLKYCILIGLAACIHSSAIVFLFFLIVRFRVVKIKTIIYFTTIMLCLATLINNSIIPGTEIIMTLLNSDRFSRYAGGGRFGWLLQLVLTLYGIYIGRFLQYNNCDVEKRMIQLNINNIITFSIVFLPLCMMSMVYERLFRYFYLLVYAQFSLTDIKDIKLKRKVFIIGATYLILIFLINSGILWSRETTIIPVLEGTPFWLEDREFYHF